MTTHGIATLTIFALAACGPNVRIVEMDSPQTACPGEDIGPRVSLAVENAHDEAIDETIQVGWYLSSDDVLDPSVDVLLVGGRDQIAGLGAMETVEVSVDENIIPETAALGEQFLIAIADESDVVTEDNEIDNVRARALRIEACAGASTVALAAGGRQTCALSDLGALRCWGQGQYGVLGYGDTEDLGDDETPTSAGDLPLGRPVIAVDAGFHHTCAVLEGGAVRCWGRNHMGQLGQGHTDDLGDDETLDTVPDIGLGGAAVDVAAGVAHTCALLDTGAVRCWGDAAFGQLGYGNTEAIGDDETPASAGDVSLGGTATSIDAGEFHTCAVMEGGDVRCWGSNGSFGMLGLGHVQLAIGDDEPASAAGLVDVGSPVDEVALGSVHTCARLPSGAARCWGSGPALGYGDGPTIGDDETPASAGDLALGGVEAIDAGGDHTCVVSLGEVRCWGFGSEGLGMAMVPYTDAPGSPLDLGGAVADVAAGYLHVCALMETGGVRCWGDGRGGRLGYGATTPIMESGVASAGDVAVW